MHAINAFLLNKLLIWIHFLLKEKSGTVHSNYIYYTTIKDWSRER